jgi:3-oxoadipate enol-lactonase
MQFVRLNGIAVHHQVINGPPGTPVVVFINSLGTDFRIWRDVIVRLVGQATILTYDKRGHGLTDIGAKPYTIDLLADDLAALIDHLGHRRVTLVGLSVGGLIAQRLARLRPDLVEALVLCNSSARSGSADMWAQRIAAIEAGGIEAVADSILVRWFTEKFRDPANAELVGYRNMLVRQPQAGYLGTCMTLRDTDLRSDAAAIAVPTLCVAGDQDGSTPPDVVLALAKSIPGARYELIKDCGHIPCVEQPAMLTEILRAFFELVKSDARQQRH